MSEYEKQSKATSTKMNRLVVMNEQRLKPSGKAKTLGCIQTQYS